jgi:hypothetical protein
LIFISLPIWSQNELNNFNKFEFKPWDISLTNGSSIIFGTNYLPETIPAEYIDRINIANSSTLSVKYFFNKNWGLGVQSNSTNINQNKLEVTELSNSKLSFQNQTTHSTFTVSYRNAFPDSKLIYTLTYGMGFGLKLAKGKFVSITEFENLIIQQAVFQSMSLFGGNFMQFSSDYYFTNWISINGSLRYFSGGRNKKNNEYGIYSANEVFHYYSNLDLLIGLGFHF